MKKWMRWIGTFSLQSQAWGYKAVLLALCAWTLWNSGLAWLDHSRYNPWPAIILGLAVCVQGFTQLVFKAPDDRGRRRIS